jgi:hypothetical protein
MQTKTSIPAGFRCATQDELDCVPENLYVGTRGVVVNQQLVPSSFTKGQSVPWFYRSECEYFVKLDATSGGDYTGKKESGSAIPSIAHRYEIGGVFLVIERTPRNNYSIQLNSDRVVLSHEEARCVINSLEELIQEAK